MDNSTFSRFKFATPWCLVVIFILLPFIASISYAINEDQLRRSLRQLGGSEILFDEWLRTLKAAAETSIDTRLQRINSFFNRKLLFTDDLELWGETDYWATPMESLAKGKADCEDYVIAKYFSLRSLNVPDTQLRLIYVKARIGGPNSSIEQAHMVLAFYPSAELEPLILDNLITEIRPASRRKDLTPIFSFNSQGIFSGTGSSATMGPGGVGRLSRWQALLERAKKEGFE